MYQYLKAALILEDYCIKFDQTCLRSLYKHFINITSVLTLFYITEGKKNYLTLISTNKILNCIYMSTSSS